MMTLMELTALLEADLFEQMQRQGGLLDKDCWTD